MNDRRPTEVELAEALREHLPERAGDDLAGRIAAAIEGSGQQRPLPSVFGALTDADPVVRRRAALLAAALMLAAAVAGAAAAGAMRLWDDRNPLLADELLPATVGGPGQLAFAKDGDLYIANPDGTGAVAVARGNGSALGQPRWSADGRWIALQTQEPAVLLFDTATRQLRRLASGTFGGWSPIGPELALVTPDGDLDIADIDRGETRVLVRQAYERGLGPTDCQFEYGNSAIDWSPDGRWLLISTPDQDGHLQLRKVDARTGAASVLARTEAYCQLRAALAPDSKRVAYGTYFERGMEDRLTIIDTESGATSEISDAVDPFWSPDGAWIVFQQLSEGLMVARPDGSDRRQLVHLDSALAGRLVGWQPGSHGLAYMRQPNEPGPAEMHVLSLANGEDLIVGTGLNEGAGADFAWANPTGDQTGAAVRVSPPPPAATPAPELPVTTPSAVEPAQPDATWGSLVVGLPEGDAECGLAIITFPGEETAVGRPGAAVSPPGSAAPDATAGPQAVEMCDPLFAPGGSAIGQRGRTAFVIPWKDGAPASTSIPITAGGWSPGGTWLWGQACPPRGGDSCASGWVIVRPDGSGMRDLPGRPAWSRDEGVMAVESDDGTLLVGNGDGTDLRPVGSFPLPVGSWPDASTFAFVRDGDVWLAPADGSGSRNVSAFELGGAIDAWWSPDGRYLAVLQGETMWVLAADGSVRQRIGTGLGSAETSWRADWAPAWSPDGSWMAVDRDLDGVTAVTLVHMGDWRVVRLEGAGRPVWSPDGHHLAVSHRDANGTSEVDVTNPDGSGRTTVRSEGVPLGWLR